ncbi:hypothetical protein QBC40DRAFT_257224 [Triangularia verruculosa]|uniref:Uncharacterized protein n=1 Tax=Triangularia verruculosa TaxID=2587418 RepID=A0AAN6XDA3_9PEZI|nr:hypothetical protein QBC40DRAFT_257224 [Triangularia verruculosa]
MAPTGRVFHPMDALLQPNELGHNDRVLRRVLGYSEAYKGDIFNRKNIPADIDDDMNVSVFLTNLPREYDEESLLAALLPHRPFDRIYATSVTPPGDNHDGSSAKIITFTRDGAERLLNFVNAGKLVIEGRVVRGRWNQIKTPAPGGAHYLSRVLLIEVSQDVLNETKIRELLQANIVCQTGKITIKQVKNNDHITIELPFCSYRAQAEAFRLLLAAEYPEAKVRFGVDPLAVGGKGVGRESAGDKWAALGSWRRGQGQC